MNMNNLENMDGLLGRSGKKLWTFELSYPFVLEKSSNLSKQFRLTKYTTCSVNRTVTDRTVGLDRIKMDFHNFMPDLHINQTSLLNQKNASFRLHVSLFFICCSSWGNMVNLESLVGLQPRLCQAPKTNLQCWHTLSGNNLSWRWKRHGIMLRRFLLQ